MHPSPIEILADSSASVAARVVAAAEVRRLLETERPLGAAWRTVCGVAFDERAPAEVRRAAVRAMAGAPAPVSQLVRVFAGDDDRSVRKEAVAVLRALGIAPIHAARLEAQLAAARGPNRALALANLALTFGYDPRIVAIYDEALRDPDEAVRGLAVRGLAMLGEMAQVVAALDDPAPAVRARAVEDLGLYFTAAEAEARALDRALGDSDATVRNAAIVAMRRLGGRSVAK
jgi:HEAT repeat protein